MTTFQVDDVAKATKAMRGGDTERIVLERCGSVKPESHSEFVDMPFEDSGSWRPLTNAFLAAVHAAFSNHYPLVLTPDAIWICIAQGLAHHINSNAEKLRRHFVGHEGKETLTIIRDDFVKGSPKNPWPAVFDQFSEEIKKHVGEETHDLLTPEFSTTGPVERAAAQVVLMDCFKQYFCYRMVCICGIPEITLKGSVDDWKLLREKVLSLATYDLEWWVDALRPILDQFVAAASGEVDKPFWSSIYKLKSAYGHYLINGWVVALFPYLQAGRDGGVIKNAHLNQWRDDHFSGNLTSASFPPGVVSVPFEWKQIGSDVTYHMRFFAGFMAATQNQQTLAIQAEIGWAVADYAEVDGAKKRVEEHNATRYRWF